ncbi:MAG: DUF2807 domain-containing protein [Bacteroidota bacterium]
MSVQKPFKTKWHFQVGFSFLLLLLTQFVVAQTNGNGNLDSQYRPLADYNRIYVALSCDMEIIVSNTSSAGLTITAESNLLPLINTDVTNGELVIKPTTTLAPGYKIKIKASTTALKYLETSNGPNDAYYVTGVSGADFRLLNVKADVVVDGNVRALSLQMESGNFYGNDFTTKDALIEVWGGGRAITTIDGTGCGALVGHSTSLVYGGSPNWEMQLVDGAQRIPFSNAPMADLAQRRQAVIDRVRASQEIPPALYADGGEFARQKYIASKVKVELVNNAGYDIVVGMIGPQSKRFDYDVPFGAGQSRVERVAAGTRLMLLGPTRKKQQLLKITKANEGKQILLFNSLTTKDENR